jgi:DNA-binding CsgD family transcriptional regulator
MDTLSTNELLKNLPASFYWKNKNGLYLDGNNYLKSKMAAHGVKIESSIGKTDHAIFSKKIADEIINNDYEAMMKSTGIIKQERVMLSTGKEFIFLSSKKPFINEKGQVDGIIGTSIDITDCADQFIPDSFVIPTSNHDDQSASKRLPLSGKWQDIFLTFRQAQCAYLLCQGKISNEIANFLQISIRTAEDHIKQLKLKLGCFKKSVLIDILLNEVKLAKIINFIDSRLG